MKIKESKNIKQNTYNYIGEKMKKTLKITSIIIIIMISIIIYNQTTYIIKNNDKLMIEIKNKELQYYIQPQNAIIDKETIVPGINGKKVDIKKTYEAMKKIKEFNEKYIIYKEITPEVTINKNKDKYIISGNPNKKEISIIIEIQNNTDIEEILKIIKHNNIEITLQVDENNKSINQNQTKQYETENTNTQKTRKLCILEEPNEKKLKKCSKQNKKTIIPNIVITHRLLSTIKQTIKPGQIIKIRANESTINEMDATIKYIKSKGFAIKKTIEHISEKNNN